MKSGISEYSEALVYGLAEYYDVTLLTDDYNLDSRQLTKDFPQKIYQSGKRYSEFDVVIYNIGNNPHYHMYMTEALKDNPGFIILHDFVLYYLAVGIHQRKGDLFQSIYALEGVYGISIVKDSLKQKKEPDLLEHKSIAANLPMNSEIIQMSKGIFVHSDYARNRLLQEFPEKQCRKIEHIKISFTEIKGDPFQFIEKGYKIPRDAFLIGAIGFIASTKQNVLACQAVQKYNQTNKQKIYYLMIGEGDTADTYLDQYIQKTGFIHNNEYLLAIERCDLIFNLRYPSYGETSGTLIQCMGRGKLCVTTDIGWFSELSSSVVVKVPFNITPEDLMKTIEFLKMKDNSEIMQGAKRYVDVECAPEKIAADMFEFIKRV